MIDWLSQDELQFIEEDLYALFVYSTQDTTITFHDITATPSGFAFDPTTGDHTIAKTDRTLHALMAHLGEVESGMHDAKLWSVLVHDTELSGSVPAITDRFTDAGGEVYEIEAVERALLGRVWLLTAREQ